MSVSTPSSGAEQPSLAGFAEAQDRKRLLLGSPVTFLWPAHVTFPPGTPLSPNTGQPFDPTASAIASSQASASATASVFFKAINRGGAANADVAAPIGRDERTRLFLNLASADGQVVKGLASAWAGRPFAGSGSAASEFVFRGDRFEIYAIKSDEIVLGYRRTLVYGAEIGADTNSGFSP